jgi:undecaprenyl-diphosphatase
VSFVEGYDLGVLYWVGSWHRPWLDPVVVQLTLLGSLAFLTTVVLAVGALFVLRRRPVRAAALAGAGVLAWAVESAVKALVGRPRPAVAWRLVELPNEPGFPSGHALCSMAVYGALALIVARSLHSRVARGLVIAGGFGLAVLVGLTRIYLGVHYPVDVLAGWTAGLACALLALGAVDRWEARGAPPSPLPVGEKDRPA